MRIAALQAARGPPRSTSPLRELAFFEIAVAAAPAQAGHIRMERRCSSIDRPAARSRDGLVLSRSLVERKASTGCAGRRLMEDRRARLLAARKEPRGPSSFSFRFESSDLRSVAAVPATRSADPPIAFAYANSRVRARP